MFLNYIYIYIFTGSKSLYKLKWNRNSYIFLKKYTNINLSNAAYLFIGISIKFVLIYFNFLSIIVAYNIEREK